MHFDQRSSNGISRRTFLCSAASVAALSGLSGIARATIPLKKNVLAYVACRQDGMGGDGALEVFSLDGVRWTSIQRVPVSAPACVLLSPNQQTLYVANQIGSHGGLPRGTVEAFRIDPSSGHLALLSRQPLSLSATYPRHMALSPNGKLLAVAADGGSIYNLLPISSDGRPDRPRGIFKQSDCALNTQLQIDTFHGRLLFDTNGNHLLSSGFGRDAMSTFAVGHSPNSRRMRQRTLEIDNADAFVLHPDGSMLYLLHEAGSCLSCYRYDSASGQVAEAIQRISTPTQYGASISRRTIAVHPSGHMLYTTEAAHRRLQAWRINSRTGLLSQANHIEFDGTSGDEIIVSSNGQELFVFGGLRGSIHRMAVDDVTGELGSVEEVAMIRGARNMAFKML